MESYETFLNSKCLTAPSAGVEVEEVNPKLFGFQRDITKWALRKGRAALFTECGTGKTPMQLEWAHHVAERFGPVLILAPLAVAHQTVMEGKKFGINVTQAFSHADVNLSGITVTNYQRLEKFNTSIFAGVVLDESSILKSFSGTTKRALLEAFSSTRFKLACTATPAPNDYLELGNHADFLSVMPSNEMISRWFINNSMSFGDYRLKKHAEADFWKWVASWSVCVTKPSDLGYKDDGFILPPLNLIPSVVPVDHTKSAGEFLFRMGGLSATTMHKEMRLTAEDRCRKALELVRENGGTWIVWCNTNYEADILKRLMPDAIEVNGSESIEQKECKLNLFSDGLEKIIITKPSLAGFGLNWQHCHQMVYVGLSYSYEQLYQSLRRSFRFGQTEQVNAHIIYAETEGKVMESINQKALDHEKMKSSMAEAVKEVQLEELYGRKSLKMNYVTRTEKGEDWELRLGDCVDLIKDVPKDSIGLSVFSPPFSNLYIYSDSVRDMGNSADDDEFIRSMKFLIPELLRATIPGRLCAVHCKDLPRYKGTHGAAGLWDFPGALITAFEECGWQYHSRVTIWKDPVIEMQRTKNHGLLYKQLRKDSSASRQGMADYVICFRKWTGVEEEFPDPITHTHEEFPLDQWQKWASPVWMDIRQTNVLNIQQAREDKDEKHICPLQLDLIERCIRLWSNPRDLIFDPFSGVGSTGYEAILLNRRFLGLELKESYMECAAKNLIEATRKSTSGTLFASVPSECATGA